MQFVLLVGQWGDMATTQLGWCGIIISEKPTTPHPPHQVPLHFRQHRKLNFVMQPYLNSTRKIWKMTSIFRKMEVYLNILKMSDFIFFSNWKTTSNLISKCPKFSKIEDDLICFWIFMMSDLHCFNNYARMYVCLHW